MSIDASPATETERGARWLALALLPAAAVSFLAARWQAGAWTIDDAAITMGGDIPVNPSGGVISTNPIGATALIRVAEASLQIQGRAGARQVDGAKTALATGFGGSYWHEVFVLANA